MLQSVRVHHFRSCREAVLTQLGNLTALVGRNGAGKTNVMKAIAWAASSHTAVPTTEGSFAPNTQPDVELEFDVLGRTLVYRVKLEFDRDAAAAGRAKEIYGLSQWLHEKSGSALTPIFSLTEKTLRVPGTNSEVNGVPSGFGANAFVSVPSLFPNLDTLHIIRTAAKFLQGIRYYPFETTGSFEVFFSNQQLDAWKSGQAPLAVNEASYKLASLWEDHPAKFAELCELVGENGLNIVRKITIQKLSAGPQEGLDGAAKVMYYVMHFVTHGLEDNIFGFSALSYGTQRVLTMLISLMFDQASLSLIEQPEDGIHTALLRKLIPLLNAYAEAGQFIMATQSEHVLNALAPSDIRLVTMGERGTVVTALNAEQVEIAREYMAEDGPLSDYIKMIAS
jgi:hypothetical protein